ncbi:transmembrane emp24 domain-containing protein p24delta7 [Syzygium oleosum]|uniref:transmembrane emp24 domain-containing protein p24delta7 n=1 Tax=Syzygium oleosum TaxID=219896 RepID=UPI0011D28ACF|nr:transmembrane emp24 domain-containing protein p24delta7 [Syzygium oleosum]
MVSPPHASRLLHAVLVATLLGFLAPASHSLRFELHSGHTKCIAEDIRANSMTVGKFAVVNPHEGHPLPESHRLSARVTSPHGTSYHQSENVESGQFAFTVAEAGDYTACLWAPEHKPEATLTVDFDWRTGVAASDWSNVAKKGQVDVMELELKKLYETIDSIHTEMFYLREREEEMEELNQATNAKMAWLSGLSLFVCLSVAGLQLWHLKTFFEKKKII